MQFCVWCVKSLWNKVQLFNIGEFKLQNFNSSIFRDEAIRMQSEECEYRDNLCVRSQSYAHIHGAYSLDNFPTLKKVGKLSNDCLTGNRQTSTVGMCITLITL